MHGPTPPGILGAAIRALLRRGSAIVVGAALTGCLAPDPALDPDRTVDAVNEKEVVRTGTTAPLGLDPEILRSRRFHEAPTLAERVAAGSLPPVSERLPEKPVVVVPVDQIGRYGGTINRALTGDIIQTAGTSKTLGEDLMGFSRPIPDSIEFNLAESTTFFDGGKRVRFRLRRGLRWSDGQPFSVDDVLFWYHDVQLDDNARNAAVPPSVWIVDNEPVEMVRVDSLTLEVRSKKPLGRILHAFSGESVLPRHRFAHLHPKYNPSSDYQTFRDSTTAAQLIMAPGVPRMSAWVPVEWTRGERIVYERNPYYYKVDTEGNQLPYADNITFTVIQDPQVILLRFINGQIDLFGRYSRIDMFPTLRAEEKKGKFRLRITGPERGPALYLNWDTPSSIARRDAIRDRAVRIALSHAVNREEINQILYHGLLEPSGYAFGRSNPYFDESAYRMFADYDPDLARRTLDEAGYPDSDGDGWREFRDGSRFELTIDVMGPDLGVDVCTLIAAHWEAIGVKTNLNIALRDIIWPRRLNGEFDIHYWSLEGPSDPLGRMNDWAALAPTVPFWHRTAFESGPPWLAEATQHIRDAVTSIDPDDLRRNMVAAQELHVANVPVIVVGSAYHVWGASTRLGNVPMDNSAADVHRGWSRPVFHEQIFVHPDTSGTRHE